MRLSLARLGRWPRLLAAGTCLLLALAGALHTGHATATDAARTAPVVVASRQLAAGQRISAADVRVARWPTRLVPDGALTRLSAVLHHRVAGPLARGEPITRSRLVDAPLTAGLPRDRAAVPVALADAHAAELIRPGERVTLFAAPDPDAPSGGFDDGDVAAPGDDPASDPSGASARSGGGAARPVATALLVLAVLPGTDVAAAELVVAAGPDTAARLAAATDAKAFTAVVVRP